jgi:hypothetical protein
MTYNTDRLARETNKPAIVTTHNEIEAELVAKVNRLQKEANTRSWELADTYDGLRKIGWTQQAIAKLAGCERSSVSRFLACVKKCALGHNRPPFWEVYREIKEGSSAAKNDPPEAPDPPKPEPSRNGHATTATADSQATTTEPEPPPDREPGDDSHIPKDAEGEEVPAHAVEAFQHSGKYEDWAKRLDALRREAVELAETPAGTLVQIEDMKLQGKRFKDALLQNRPTHVCPYCNGGDKKTCACCKGRGWTCAHVYGRWKKEQAK